MNCPLCNSDNTNILTVNGKKYFRCIICSGIFLTPAFYISLPEEKRRYEKHKNNSRHKGYRRFVSPLLHKLLLNESKESSGIDFGCGHIPVLSLILKDMGYNIFKYDPIFYNEKKLLKISGYDYVVCCEVFEHFHNPLKELSLIYSILKSGGNLYHSLARIPPPLRYS